MTQGRLCPSWQWKPMHSPTSPSRLYSSTTCCMSIYALLNSWKIRFRDTKFRYCSSSCCTFSSRPYFTVHPRNLVSVRCRNAIRQHWKRICIFINNIINITWLLELYLVSNKTPHLMFKELQSDSALSSSWPNRFQSPSHIFKLLQWNILDTLGHSCCLEFGLNGR